MNNTLTLTLRNYIDQMTFSVFICSRPPSSEKKNTSRKGREISAREGKNVRAAEQQAWMHQILFHAHVRVILTQVAERKKALLCDGTEIRCGRTDFSAPWRSEICEMETVTLRPRLKWVWSIWGLLGQYQNHRSSREKQPQVKRLRDASISHGVPWIHRCKAQVEVISVLSTLPVASAWRRIAAVGDRIKRIREKIRKSGMKYSLWPFLWAGRLHSCNGSFPFIPVSCALWFMLVMLVAWQQIPHQTVLQWLLLF